MRHSKITPLLRTTQTENPGSLLERNSIPDHDASLTTAADYILLMSAVSVISVIRILFFCPFAPVLGCGGTGCVVFRGISCACDSAIKPEIPFPDLGSKSFVCYVSNHMDVMSAKAQNVIVVTGTRHFQSHSLTKNALLLQEHIPFCRSITTGCSVFSSSLSIIVSYENKYTQCIEQKPRMGLQFPQALVVFHHKTRTGK